MEKLIVTPEQRTTTIELGGKEYEMLLTTDAMIELTDKFGGTEEVATKLKEGTLAEQVKVLRWLITLLVNQGIKRRNYENGTKEPEITEEYVGVMTDIPSLSAMQDRMLEAMLKGLGKNIQNEIEGEEDSKNPEA